MRSNFNYRNLAESLVNNGQPSLPPSDVIRQGVVVGYDPNYNGNGHDYPVLSVQLGGETDPTVAPLHNIRFIESYAPNLGDTVWLVMTGEDGWVLGSLAGADKDTVGTIRSAVSIIGHGAFSDKTAISASTETTLKTTGITTPLLPNRLYKVELTAAFTITNASPIDIVTGDITNTSATVINISPSTTGFVAGAEIVGEGIPAGTTIKSVDSSTQITLSQNATKTKTTVPLTIYSTHALSVGINTPSGYYPISEQNIFNGSLVVSGHTTWWNTTTSHGYPLNWLAQHTDATYKWEVVAKVSSTGGTNPTATASSQRVVIYDLGVAG